MSTCHALWCISTAGWDIRHHCTESELRRMSETSLIYSFIFCQLLCILCGTYVQTMSLIDVYDAASNIKITLSAGRLKSPASRSFAQPFFSGADQRKYQCSVLLVFVREPTGEFPVQTGTETRKGFISDDVMMYYRLLMAISYNSFW